MIVAPLVAYWVVDFVFFVVPVGDAEQVSVVNHLAGKEAEHGSDYDQENDEKDSQFSSGFAGAQIGEHSRYANQN